MTLSDILEYIESLLNGDERLQSVVVADVYEYWNHTNSSNQYISAVVDFVNSNYNADYTDYQFIVYVGNVIDEKQNNIYSSISIADSVIQQMLHKIDVQENDMNLVIPNVITPFTQKFEDVLVGCYCQFSLRIKSDIIC